MERMERHQNCTWFGRTQELAGCELIARYGHAAMYTELHAFCTEVGPGGVTWISFWHSKGVQNTKEPRGRDANRGLVIG